MGIALYNYKAQFILVGDLDRKPAAFTNSLLLVLLFPKEMLYNRK